MPNPNFQGPENQLWLEEWLKHRKRHAKEDLANLNNNKVGIRNLDLSRQDLKGEFVIENFPDIVTLNMGNNELTDLKVHNCPKLERIIVSHNKLKNLKIENCPEVKELYTFKNQLTTLDVSELKKLEILSYCCDDRSCCPHKIKAAEPDEPPTPPCLCKLTDPCPCRSNNDCHCNNFSPEEKDKLDALGHPEKLPESEKPRRHNTAEFIGDFVDLDKFVDNDTVTEIDVSNLASEGNLTDQKLEIKNCPNLTFLNVDNCGLKELVIKNCPNLKTLSFRFNQIRNIDLKGLTNLEGLYCSANRLSKLDLSQNERLKHLVCDNNPIKRLEVKHLKNLESLYCFRCDIKGGLNVTGLTKLKELYCANNALSKIVGLTTCENLAELDCAENELFELDISGLKNLEFISCKENQIETFSAKSNKKLSYLDYSSQTLLSIREVLEQIISKEIKEPLKTVLLSFKKRYKNLIVSSETLARSCLFWLKKPLKTINLKDCPNLEKLICSKEPISEEEVKNFPKLRVLTVDNKEVPWFKERLNVLNRIRGIFFQKMKTKIASSVGRNWKKYLPKLKAINELISLINPTKSLQELEEVYTSIKNHVLYKVKKQKIDSLYLQKKSQLTLEENTRREKANQEKEQEWTQQQQKHHQEQQSLEKSLLAQSISSVKNYWTNKKILDTPLEKVLGSYWEQRFKNKKVEHYPAIVSNLRDLIDYWIKINRPEEQKPPTITITEDLINNFSSTPNFETKEKVEELLAPLKDNEEFLQQNPDLTNKSPKEIVIAAKRVEYSKDKENKDNKIHQYYNLKEEVILTDHQINEYLYLEATGQLQEQKEQTTPSGQPQSNGNWITPLIIIVVVWMIGLLGILLMAGIRKRKIRNKNLASGSQRT